MNNDKKLYDICLKMIKDKHQLNEYSIDKFNTFYFQVFNNSNQDDNINDLNKSVLKKINEDYWINQWYLDFELHQLMGLKNVRKISKDYNEAIKYYELAADQGKINAQYKLGVIYNQEKYLLKNDCKALKYFNLAANQGDSRAQYNLGLMYENGDGVKQDYKEAIKYYDLAADQENTYAINSLLRMYKI